MEQFDSSEEASSRVLEQQQQQEEMKSLRRQVAAEYGYATDWSGVGSVNLRNMAVPSNQPGQPTQQLQFLPDATTARAPTLIDSANSVQSCAAVEPPMTTSRPNEMVTPTRYEDTPKSSKLVEERRSARAASLENRKRRTRNRQRSVSNRRRGSTSDSSSEDEQKNLEKETESFNRRKKIKASKRQKQDGWRGELSHREEVLRHKRDTLLHSSSDTSDEEEDSRCGKRDKDGQRREKYADKGQRRREARERLDLTYMCWS